MISSMNSPSQPASSDKAHSPTAKPARKPRAHIVRNQPLGVGGKNARNYMAKEEILDAHGQLRRRILERPEGGSPYTAQTKINAFNFPFTGNPGSGCFFQCVYCYLRQPFFQRHVTADHGKEMNYVPVMAATTRRFLAAKAELPQYMKRVQMGVSTEMFMPQMAPYTKPDEVLRTFQRHGQDWMVHLVTKSPAILDYADLLAEMKAQVQVEVSLVTLDEASSRIFEQGTPSVAQRLRIIEQLATRGIFVRLMLMPVMREYELRSVGDSREIVFQHSQTGERRPGRKRMGRVDGNFGVGQVPLELHDGRRWVPADDGDAWKPIVVKDWSNAAHAQAHWRNYGASAYKQKDLNYFYVDDLIAAHSDGRAPKEERGRSEDPTAEVLIHSGETVKDAASQDRVAAVRAWHLPRKEWGGEDTRQPPEITRRVMDFGYALHSKVDWIDCV
jgi:DNA repair photolyase